VKFASRILEGLTLLRGLVEPRERAGYRPHAGHSLPLALPAASSLLKNLEIEVFLS
jgi:hypothetical protein